MCDSPHTRRKGRLGTSKATEKRQVGGGSIEVSFFESGTDMTLDLFGSKQGKKGGKSKKKGSSPPILRLKLTPLRRKSTKLVPRTPRTPRTADMRASRRSLKPVPEVAEPVEVARVPRFLPPGSRPAVRMSDTR